MRRAAFLPVGNIGDQASAHQTLPAAIHHHLGEAFVLRRCDKRCQSVARILGVFGQRVGNRLITKPTERPGGLYFGAGLKRDFDQRLAARLVQAARRNTA